MSIDSIQKDCCKHYQTTYSPIEPAQLVTISKGIYEGVTPVEGVRYPSPSHMSGWWLTTDEYDGNISSMVTVHFEHIMEKRPELAIYMALPFGYRFYLGSESEHVWFDEDVANESI
ncbi:immunity protein Imm33 domain-containing protein [Vibrio europaeus]|uniref:immunity protein Imm33 domain-containing protein n=1 Tax=Vibrio europaeus TaxID=300876 RepID=UPI00148BBA7A|nr:hypothetical protein [Vibrio europaeus]NOH26381.1 hypothetical protein [Vibrio europaeus]